MHHQGAELNALELEHGVDLRKKKRSAAGLKACGLGLAANLERLDEA